MGRADLGTSAASASLFGDLKAEAGFALVCNIQTSVSSVVRALTLWNTLSDKNRPPKRDAPTEDVLCYCYRKNPRPSIEGTTYS